MSSERDTIERRTRHVLEIDRHALLGPLGLAASVAELRSVALTRLASSVLEGGVLEGALLSAGEPRISSDSLMGKRDAETHLPLLAGRRTRCSSCNMRLLATPFLLILFIVVLPLSLHWWWTSSRRLGRLTDGLSEGRRDVDAGVLEGRGSDTGHLLDCCSCRTGWHTSSNSRWGMEGLARILLTLLDASVPHMSGLTAPSSVFIRSSFAILAELSAATGAGGIPSPRRLRCDAGRSCPCSSSYARSTGTAWCSPCADGGRSISVRDGD